MGHIFRIECKKCMKNMRFDYQQFIKWDRMKWTCWNCEYTIVTTNLHDTVVFVGSEEE